VKPHLRPCLLLRLSLLLLVAALAAGTSSAQSVSSSPNRPAEPGIEAAFRRESYSPGSVASLELFGKARGLTVQIFHAGAERGRTRRRDVMRGVRVSPRRWIGRGRAGAVVRVVVGRWASGLYFAKLTSLDDRVGYAPFVVRPRRLGRHRVLVVLPTYTWQAYNFRDDNGDSIPDTWYYDRSHRTVRLGRPFLDRGVPPHYRHYDLPFLHWLARTGKQADFLTDGALQFTPNASALVDAYNLIVFPGHHEYVTRREYDLVESYRNRGGNLAFLTANDFFWRVITGGRTIERVAKWRDLGQPEAGLIGVEYLRNDNGERKGPWIVRREAAAPWLFRATGLRPGSRFGSGGIEIDAMAQSSPRQTRVVAEIPNLYGPGSTAQMTYYEMPRGAKVFAAGAFLLAESVLEPDAPLPDLQARANERAARRMLENLWAQLSRP
jgi:N,N-dimethylformamidase beta subunit-like, C-terminal